MRRPMCNSGVFKVTRQQRRPACRVRFSGEAGRTLFYMDNALFSGLRAMPRHLQKA